MRFSHNFYLDLLSFLKDKCFGFYWGEDESGYYWGDKTECSWDEGEDYRPKSKGFNTLQDLVEDISQYLNIG